MEGRTPKFTTDYREKLAADLKEVPKEKRPDALDDARNKAAYWENREEKMQELYPYEPAPSAYSDETVRVYSEGQRALYKKAGEQEKKTNVPDIPTEGVVRALSIYLENIQNARVVDVGSGERVGYLERWKEASPNIRVVIGIEPSDAMREKAAAQPHSEEIVLQGGDWLNTRLPSESVDMVIGRYSFHHVEDIEAAYTEIARILKASGKAVIEIPHPNSDKTILEQEIATGKRPAGEIADKTPITKNILGADIHSFYHPLATYTESPAFKEHFRVIEKREGDWKRGTWELKEGEAPNALELVIEKIN